MSELDSITHDEFVNWRDSRVTQAILSTLREQFNDISEQVMGGAFVGDRDRQNVMIGKACGINQLLDIKFSDTEEAIDVQG